METFTPGTVISGTHRKQDLLPAMLEALRELSEEGYAQFMTSPFGPGLQMAKEEGFFE